MGKRFLMGLLLFSIIMALSFIQDPANQVKQLIRFHYYICSEKYLYFEKDGYKSGIIANQQFYVKDQGSYITKRKENQVYLILNDGHKKTSFLVKMQHRQIPEHITSLHHHVRYVLKH